MSLLTDGFSLTIDLTGAGTTFEEISGKLPSIDGGEKIPVTTMRNETWMTYALQKLLDMKDASLRVAYDSAVLGTIQAQINVLQEIVFTLPDGSTFTFWGAMKTFEPSEFKKGERPEADIVIACTNLNDSGTEVAPVYAAAP